MIKVTMHNPSLLKQHKDVLDDLKVLVADIENKGVYQFSSKSKPITLSKTEMDFIKYLNGNKQAKLLWIVNSDALEIRDKIVNELETKFSALAKDRNKVGKKRVHFSRLYNLASYLFIKNGYNKLTLKGEFYRALQLHVCPYCNISEIWPIAEKGRNDTMKGELDHYYCKSRFPYLAFSKYNLIPSCRTCNGKSRKGEKDFYKLKVLHPYLLIDNEGMNFKYRLTRHKHKAYDDLWRTFYPDFSFAPQIGLEENFNEFRLKPLYQEETHRRLIVKTESVVRKFCNTDYVKFIELDFLSNYGIKPDFDSLLKQELNIQSNHDRYSDYPNNKFILDIFQDALKKSGQKLQI